MTQIDQHLQTVHDELLHALEKHPEPFNSAHEAYAVINKEMEEMWDEIKRDDLPKAREEAAQLAAMAVRLMLELDIEPTQSVTEQAGVNTVRFNGVKK